MTRAVLWVLVAHWRRSPLLLFTLVAGLAIATALWSGVQAINAEARANYDAAAATLGSARYTQLRPRVGETLPQSTYIALRRAGWQVSPVLEGQLRLADLRLLLVGIDPLTAPPQLAPLEEGDTGTLVDFLETGLIFADAATAARLEGQVDIPLVTRPGLAPDTAITDMGIAQRMLGLPGRISRLVVAPEQPIGLPPLADVAPDLVSVPPQPGGDIAQLTGSFHLNLSAFALLSFAVGVFVVQGAVGLVFEQRRPLVRTLRALGVPLRRLVVLMAAEMTALALLAGALGLVAGYLVAALLLPDVAATLEGLYGAQVAGTLQLRPAWWLSGLGIALIGMAVASGRALWAIARMPLLASARPRAWAMAAGRARRMQLAGGAALLVVAGGIGLAGDGLIAGFGLLGCLLIGAALLLPVALDLALAAGQRLAKAPVAQWFWADTRQQLPGLSLALMALLLAVATNVGVSTMVSSFRLAFVAFLDQRLAAELYVRVADPDAASALEAALEQQAATVLPYLSVETRLAGLPAELRGIRVDPTYTELWTFAATGGGAVWDRLAAGEAVMVSEQLARRAGLWLGDSLPVGPGVTLPIAAVFADYGNPVGQAIVSEPLFRTLHPDVPPSSFGLRTGDPASLRETLAADVGLPGALILDQAAQKAVALQVFERTFTVTGALNALTLAVAAFAMLMSMMTLAALRLPQVAPVWALGVTRRRLAQAELARTLALAAFTAVLALPLGLALAWVLLTVVNVKAFGWLLPMHLFPAGYLQIGLYSLAAAALAGLWPAARLLRLPPAELLKVFAHER